MHREVDRVDAEAVDSAVEPEASDVQQRVLHRRIVDVEIGLLRQEVVHIILAASGVPGPRGAAEHRLPVVRRRTIRLGVGPDVPIGLLVVAARAALPEPFMLVGAVGIDLVDDDLEAEPVRALDQGGEIAKRSEHRIDRAKIGDVVAEVAHGRGEEWR